MAIAKNEGNTNKKIYSALVHVFWILIMATCITIIVTQIFRGSNIGRIIILAAIFVYVIFSFVRKFWAEKKTKNILDAIDVTLTLVGGILLMLIYRASSGNDYSAGYALAKTAFSTIQAEPHIIIFCLGLLLLVVGTIRMVVINRMGIKYRARE